MSNANPNQSAFPPNAGWEASDAKGLTKREYFAAKAMQGLCTGTLEIKDKAISVASPQVVCKWAVDYADELLKQLESK